MTAALETFFNAWSETDAAARSALIGQALSDEARYADPRTPEALIGIAAISDYVGMFSANAPGWSAKVLSSDTVDGTLRATVAFGGPGPEGTDMVQHGQYFAQLDGGTISRLVGFVGTGAPA